MAKRRTYTDKFKAGAVVMVESEGYPNDKYALGRVASKLNINKRTLRRWVENDTGAPSDEIVTQEKNGIIDLIDAEIEAAFKEMPNARGGHVSLDSVEQRPLKREASPAEAPQRREALALAL